MNKYLYDSVEVTKEIMTCAEEEIAFFESVLEVQKEKKSEFTESVREVIHNYEDIKANCLKNIFDIMQLDTDLFSNNEELV